MALARRFTHKSAHALHKALCAGLSRRGPLNNISISGVASAGISICVYRKNRQDKIAWARAYQKQREYQQTSGMAHMS